MSTSHQHFSVLIFEIVPQPFFMLAHLKINSNMCLFDGYLLMSYQRNMMFKFRHFRQFKGCLYHIMWSTYGSVYAGREKWPFNVISHDDVGIVFCSKRMLNENKQTKILFDMHFVDHSNFSSLNLVSSRS